jgi:mannosyltransferase OCH1-like enzyme
MYPDYTPAAIVAATILRQSDQFATALATNSEVASPIPRRIVQFWDDAPPDDVKTLMASWQEFNLDHKWIYFDDHQAKEFLQSEFGGEVLQAYHHARLPAQKADLFRLAYLAARGGVYADADDRCFAPLDGYIRPNATLVVYQENFGSLGNNFIAATAAHPVITRALELAAAAMNRLDKDLVWLSTGPGLFTRAFAQVWAGSKPGCLLLRTQVLDLGPIQRVIGMHCPVRYKSTDLHWSRSSFGNGKRAFPKRGSAPGDATTSSQPNTISNQRSNKSACAVASPS